ncbi:MAG TPA: choice-of-anchor Q domain-containing protein [Candidatus Angelobacter sp.]|nr:choice-of-anchor Q domain-containing protein [Candidatus Angelobacter sp.]
MRKLINSVSLVSLIFSTLLVCAQAAPPRIYFSDLESGPNTGGQGNNGVWVTIWGKGFGATQGTSTITIGGGAAASYPLWSDGKITFQLGPAAGTGNILVNVPGVGTSNGLPFTVRTGNIFFVSTTGNDANTGTFASPWKTIPKAKNSIGVGDTAYIENGVAQTSEDNFTAYLSMDNNGASNSGTATAPKALIAYPNASVTVGVAGGLHYGIRTPNISANEDYWVISQLHIIGGTQAMDLGGTGWRIIGNEMQCPGADDQVGCFEMSEGSQTKFYGNEVHNAGINPTSSKFYHAVYFSTDSNHIDVGWNHIHDNFTCRALQFHSSPLCSPTCGTGDTTGFNQYDLHVHDNLIHGDNCNGINFATVDPSKGVVEAYNNVVYHVGLINPLQLGAAFSCIYVAGITNNGVAGTGTVDVFNNTLSDCAANNSANASGSRGAFGVGGGPATLLMRLRNNVAYQLPGEIYIDGATSQINGSNNLWFGVGAGPAQTAGNLATDPQFVNRSIGDYHIASTSPAKDAGLTIVPSNPFVPNPGPTISVDKDGVLRPQGTAFDLGAYEFFSGSTSRPNPPSNVHAVVH